MDIRLIDHHAAEAAIRATQEYADELQQLRAALHRHGSELQANWQGNSYRQLATALGRLARELMELEEQSLGTKAVLIGGYEQACDAEEKARRKAEQAAQQAKGKG